MAKKTQRLSVKMTSYDQAVSVVGNYTEDRAHLISLVEKYCPQGSLIVDSSDHAYLKHCGRTIKGVAEKMLASSPIRKNIELLANTTDPNQREFIDERICLQMDSVSTRFANNYFNYLVKLYNHAKEVN